MSEPYDGGTIIVRGVCEGCQSLVEWCGKLTPEKPEAKCGECGRVVAWLTEEDDD